MSAKRVDTSVRLVGDDFCMVARQNLDAELSVWKSSCELSVWKSSVCERGDRLVIKLPYLPRQGVLPRCDKHLSFDSVGR